MHLLFPVFKSEGVGGWRTLNFFESKVVLSSAIFNHIKVIFDVEQQGLELNLGSCATKMNLSLRKDRPIVYCGKKNKKHSRMVTFSTLFYWI